jgi:hypothetical protein
MDTVGICVPTRQITEFYTFSMISALRYSSAKSTIAANEICKFSDIFSTNILSFEFLDSLLVLVSFTFVLV